MSLDFEGFLPEEPDSLIEQIETLQNQLNAERDLRREERFFFIVALVILLNVVFFSVLETWGGPIALLILEAMILIPIAKRLGIQEVRQIIDKLLDQVRVGQVSGSEDKGNEDKRTRT